MNKKQARTPIFLTTVNRKNKIAMAEYLARHRHYYVTDEINKSRTYANSLHKIPVTSDAMAANLKALFTGELECPDLSAFIADKSMEFYQKYQTWVGINGNDRLSLVMYDVENEDGHIYVRFDKGVDDDLTDLDANAIRQLKMPVLRAKVRRLLAFDTYCEEIAQKTIDVLNHYVIVEVPIYHGSRKSKKYAKQLLAPNCTPMPVVLPTRQQLKEKRKQIKMPDPPPTETEDEETGE